MPFELRENETVLWEGRAVFTRRLLYVTIFALVLLGSGVFLAAVGMVGNGVALMLVSVWFFLFGLLYRGMARGNRYHVTNQRVVREKFPVLTELSIREITRVRANRMFGLFGLWGLYVYGLVPDTSEPSTASWKGDDRSRMVPYYVVFSYLNKEDPGRIKRLVEEAKQCFTPDDR